MEALTLLGLLQAGTEEVWRLQAAEHDAARDGQTRLQTETGLTSDLFHTRGLNPEDSTGGAWRLQAGTEEVRRFQARTEGGRNIGR